MGKLSNFKRNVNKAREQGEWVPLGEEAGDPEILTRGFWDEYTDLRNATVRSVAVRRYRGDTFKITTAENRDITVDCLKEKVLIDVRNLTDDNEQPVPFAAFIDMLRDPDYADLFNAVCNACATVGMKRNANTEDDVKNS